jgi:hypothetical protein
LILHLRKDDKTFQDSLDEFPVDSNAQMRFLFRKKKSVRES